MSNYYREQGYHSRKRLLRRLKYSVLVLALAVLVGLGFLAYDIYRQSVASDTPSNSTKAVTSVITTDTQIQTTPYFQFQTSNKWRAIANETKEGHYVYRQFNGQLVEQELVVDVNRTVPEVLALVQTTRVMPVSITEAGTLKVEGSVSDHCKKSVPKGTEKTQQIVKMHQVSFACNPDGTRFIAVVGVIGGGTTLTIPRPNNGTATYHITYSNVMAQPSGRDLDNILRTFETR